GVQTCALPISASTSANSAPAPPPKRHDDGGSGGSSPPPRRRRPNNSLSLRLKLRHSSSRSGGPWLPPPGPCGPREPPRPQLGSFNDMDGQLVRVVNRQRLGRPR